LVWVSIQEMLSSFFLDLGNGVLWDLIWNSEHPDSGLSYTMNWESSELSESLSEEITLRVFSVDGLELVGSERT
jgi:hypothetical protein